MAKKMRNKMPLTNLEENSHPFEVGKHYHNRDGEYRVLSIDDPNMIIRYLNGHIIESSIELQARIWENIQEHDVNGLGLENV